MGGHLSLDELVDGLMALRGTALRRGLGFRGILLWSPRYPRSRRETVRHLMSPCRS